MNHRLQLFDTPESLGEAVAAFLLEGYRHSDPLLIVAKPRHMDAVLTSLRASGCFPADADATTRLVCLDAAEMLRAITRNGLVDAGLFRKTIKPVVDALASTGRLRIYGEIVELLAEEGDMAGALTLERLWNALAAEVPFTLMCGYSSAHFTGDAARSALRQICLTHTASIATEDDPLGSYLLALA